MKRVVLFVLCMILVLCSVGCNAPPSAQGEGETVCDADGRKASLSKGARVVACNASLADIWLLSGGSLVGVTEDAVEDGLVSDSSVGIVGTVKNINLEAVVSLSPDYVILSADLAAHLQLEASLKAAGIAYGYFRVDTFSDYGKIMEQFCAVNQRPDLFDQHVTQVGERIDSILARIPSDHGKTFLLMRVTSTAVKAKGEDNLAGQILGQFGLRNIADAQASLLEDFSVEQIVLSDPDFIFTLTMGSETAAAEFLEQNVENNPAWAGLSAVRGQKYVLLPKDLFHYKPNERWDESYEYLAKLIFPEIFGE